MLTTTRGSASLRAQLESERAESVADASALSRVLAVASDATCAGDEMTEALVAIRRAFGWTYAMVWPDSCHFLLIAGSREYSPW